jgi:iron complex outermembrane receptor protein
MFSFFASLRYRALASPVARCPLLFSLFGGLKPAATLLLFCPLLLFSQTGPDTLTSKLETRDSKLKTVVIQATRTGAKSAVPHTNLSAETIARSYQAQDVPFLLAGTPSLVENSDAGAGIGYTGMRIRGSDPTRINVTINGVPLNDAESQGVFWVNLPDLAASAAEIQVQRGVGTSTNGAGAFGATVNLDIAQVNPEPFATITNSLGSFGSRKHAVHVGTGLLGEKVAFAGRLSQIASNGYVDRATSDLRSYHFTGAYVDDRQSLQMHLLSGYERTYQAWYGLPAQYLETESLRTYNAAGTERPGEPYPDEVDDYTQRHYLLHYKRLLAQGLDLQLNGHYTRGFGFYEQYKAGQLFSAYGLPPLALGDTLLESTDLVRRRWLDNHFYGGTFALRWSPAVNPPVLTSAPVLLLGGALSRYDGRHFGDVIWADYGVPKNTRYYDNDADKRDANLFGKIELFFRGGLSAMLDLQFRQVRYAFLGFDQNQNNVTQTATLRFFNPKAGLHWQFRPGWTAHAFVGVGQREPNRDDYTQSTPTSRPRPERMLDWEGGLKRQAGDWSLSANLFLMDYRDQLVLDGRINDVGAYIRTNVPRSYRAGIELEAAARAGERLTFTGNAAFSRNKVREFVEYRDNWDTGEQDILVYKNTDLAFSPPVVARVEATWEVLPAGKKHHLAVSLSGKYVGKQFLDNTGNENTTLPAYFFSDLRLNYDLTGVIGRQVRLILAVNNLLDARYAANGWAYRFTSAGYDERPDNPYTRLEGNGVYHQAGFFPQAGRNVMGTVVVGF